MLNPYLIAGMSFVFVVSIGAAYTIGHIKGNAKAEVEIAEYESEASKKISELNAKIKEAEGKVVIEYVDRVKRVKEKEYVYVDSAKNDVGSNLELNEGWVYLHDVSAKGEQADREIARNKDPSGVADNEALAVVVTNYSRCRENAEQLRSLQNWISTTKTTVDKQNETK
jgi:hypothetical protein